MGLSTLISAIEYMEYMEEIQRQMGRQSSGNVEGTVASTTTSNISSNPLHFRRLDSTASGSVVINQEQRHHHHPRQVPIEEVPKEATKDTRFSFSKNNGMPAGMLARRRKMHNILEKSRRAQMRGCLNVLKEMLPPPTSHSGTPYGRILTTSTTLVNSVKYIKLLEKEGGELEGEVEKLKEIKKEMEEKLVELKGEGGGDLEVPLEIIKMEEEENQVEITSVPVPSSSTAAATPTQPGLPPLMSSLDISPVPGVTVEEAVTITPAIPSPKFNDDYCNSSRGCPIRASVNPTLPPPPPGATSTQMSPFGSSTTPVLCDILRRGLPSASPPSYQAPGGPHGYFYNDANQLQRSYPNPPPSPFAPPIVQFLFVNNFFNMLPFCSLPGGRGGGGCGGGGVGFGSSSAASSPPPLDYFTQGLSGGGGGSGGGCYGAGGGRNNSRFFS